MLSQRCAVTIAGSRWQQRQGRHHLVVLTSVSRRFFSSQSTTAENVSNKVLSSKTSAAATTATATKQKRLYNNLLVFGVGVCVGGFFVSNFQDKSTATKSHVLPSGLPRSCACEEKGDGTTGGNNNIPLTEEQKALPKRLERIVGSENVLDGTVMNGNTQPFLKGARLGSGKALCIVTPTKLRHILDCVQLILDANCVIIAQGQNTGLTGGSVPRNHEKDADRPVVIFSMKKLQDILPIDDGNRVLCLAGAGLASLERFLNKHFPNRESHSQLGSTFLNPTTAAGVAFGSGGTQVRKGPAYTERALYLKVNQNKWNENVIEVVNTLGIKELNNELQKVDVELKNKVDEIPYKLDILLQKSYESLRMLHSDTRTKDGTAPAHDDTYAKHVCKLDNTISRYNANTKGIDCNRSEGKVLILATIHDTFPKPIQTKTYWISFDTIETAFKFRKEVCLSNSKDLPMSMEYMDRDTFDVIDRSGRILGNIIKFVGTSSEIVRTFWNIKLRIEALPFETAPYWIDKLLHMFNPIFPPVLPSSIQESGLKMNHHVAMTIGDYNDGNMERLMQRLNEFVSQNGNDKVVVHECSGPKQSASLNSFRFVAAPAFRTWCIGEGVQGYSVDYALPKNTGEIPTLHGEDSSSSGSKEEDLQPIKRMRYSHFGCNVVHEDIAYKAGVDVEKAKHQLKHILEKKYHGKLPAEHGHGTEYHAPVEAQERWKKMDPLNVMNPGVGGLSYKFRYKE